MMFVGIDPSLAGEAAALDADGQLRHLHDPPVMAIRVGRPRKKAMAAGTNVAAFGHVCPSHPSRPAHKIFAKLNANVLCA